jgi:transposase
LSKRTQQAASSTKTEKRGDILSVLRELIAEGHIDAALSVVAKLVARNGELEKLLAGRGKKREGISANQLLLFIDALSKESESALADANANLRGASGIDAARAEAERKKAKNPPKQPPTRESAPNNLRRVINQIPVPDSERRCPKCGKERECIGHDVSDVIDLVPAEVIVRVDRREKLACRPCEGELVRAPLGDKVVPAGKLGIRLVAQLLVEKYYDGLPLHRQKHRFARMGLPLAISTLSDQVRWATDLLRPLAHAARDAVLASEVMHLDGTSLPVRDRDAPGGIKIGSLWGYVGGEEALYLYASTGKKSGQREGELGPEDFLRKRRGYTVADASGLFDESFKRKDLIEVGCNMHARRYFTKALDAGDHRAALPLAAFKKIYEIEWLAKEHDRAGRRALRQEKTKPVYAELVKWCTTFQPHEPPSSPLGKAIQYLLNHQMALTRFLDDGVLPVDNGAVERLHVRTALTRKNYLFAGSDAGAERAAIAYTVLGCAALAGVNLVEHMTYALERLARGIEPDEARELLPSRWKASRVLVAAEA